MKRCAVCWLPDGSDHWPEHEKMRRRGWVASTWLCPKCRADPANAGWVSTEDELLEEPDLEVAHWYHGDTLGSLQEKRARERTALAERIIGAIFGGRPLYVERRVRRSDGRGWRTVMRRARTRRAIARALGCSHEYVRKVLWEHVRSESERVRRSKNRTQKEPQHLARLTDDKEAV